MRFKNLDLILVILIVVLNVVWTQIPYHLTIVGILLALPLTLFFSGYTLTQVLFRRREQTPGGSNSTIRQSELEIGHPIGILDQIVLSLGLSMAIDILVGFGLNILPMGLQALSWVLSLSFLTMAFTVVAIVLRRKDVLRVAKPLQIRILWRDCVLFALALFVVASAIWLAIIRPLNPQPAFTQFWLLPANPASPAIKSCIVSVGVQSFETSSETYRVVITVNKAQTNTWSSVVLAPQQKWSQLVALTTDTSSSLYVNAQLYRTDKPDAVYRNVHLTLYVSNINLSRSVQKKCTSAN